MRRTAISLFVGALALGSMAFAHPASAKAWLGVYSQDITPELREGMNYNGAGALVTSVVPDSPAGRGGIERGDVIVRVGGQDVNSPGELIEAVGSAGEATPVDVLVVRDGMKKSLRVRLAARPEGGDSEDESPAPRMPGMRGMRGTKHLEIEVPDTQGAPGSPRIFMEHHGDSDHDNNGDNDNDNGMIMRLPELPSGGMMGRARLGVRIESLNPDLAAYFGSRDAKGALVLDVVDGSAAEKAGIRAGDVIQRVDGKAVESAEDLSEVVRSSDGAAAITLMRHGARQTVRAELGDAPKAMRLRSGRQGMDWNSKDHNKTWEWQSPDGQRRVKRIIIDGDEGSMKRHGMPADRESTDSLREEMQQLREQLDQLREELKSNR